MSHIITGRPQRPFTRFPTRYATKRKNTGLPFAINNLVSLF